MDLIQLVIHLTDKWTIQEDTMLIKQKDFKLYFIDYLIVSGGK